MKAKEIVIWSGLIIILIGGLWLLINAVNSSPSPLTTPAEIKNLPPVSATDFIRGNINAKVTLVEYADFQCPACSVIYSTIKELEGNFKDDLRVIFRFFPLTNSHQNSMISSSAAYAAGLQGKFWEMHDLLFENQTTWSNIDARDTFIGYAKTLGLNLDKFKTDLDSNSTKQIILKEENDGIAIGINSTPTFFVNGNYIQTPQSYDDFKKVIQDEINKK